MQGHNGPQVTALVLKCKFGSTKKVWNSLAYDAIVVLDPTNPKWIASGITHWEGGSHDSWHVICVLMESAIPQQLCFEPGSDQSAEVQKAWNKAPRLQHKRETSYSCTFFI